MRSGLTSCCKVDTAMHSVSTGDSELISAGFGETMLEESLLDVKFPLQDPPGPKNTPISAGKNYLEQDIQIPRKNVSVSPENWFGTPLPRKYKKR